MQEPIMKPSRKMKVSLMFVGFGLSGVLAFAPVQAQVSVTANGPYYATPSWDQKLTTGRFVVLSNWNSEAVLDRETGLVWDRSPGTDRFIWENALFRCIDREVAGRKGWRLANIQELTSLLDMTVPPPGPLLPAGHPFDIQPGSQFYWSANSIPGTLTDLFARNLNLTDGNINNVGKPQLSRAWCVRGGQGTDIQ
jgi:hypothetical protein